jgi:hypothetical protein
MVPVIAFIPLLFITTLSMGWKDTWNDILTGGSPRWKVVDLEKKAIALKHIEEHAGSSSSSFTGNNINDNKKRLTIFCPLVGDDKFVQYAVSEGHTIVGADLVPEALEALRTQQFPNTKWTVAEGDKCKIWKSDNGAVTLYETDILVPRPELEGKFDAIYDKDSFGALSPEMRKPFVQRLGSYLKDDGIVYTEVKWIPGKQGGPPFSLSKEDLMESFTSDMFQYAASLGAVYELNMPGASQTGHILRRIARK